MAVTAALIVGGLAAAGGAAGGIIGGQNARKAQKAANKANEARYAQALGLYRDSRFLTQGRLKKAEAGYARKRTDVLGGYDQARGEIEKVGQTARADILNRSYTDQRAGEQSLRRRGLFNTSTLEAMRRGARYDTNRALSALDEQIAGVRSNFLVQRAGALERMGESESQFQVQAAQTENSTIQNMINGILGRTDIATNDGGAAAGSQIGAGLGSAAGLLLAQYMSGVGTGPATQPAPGTIGPPVPGR